MIHRLWDWSMQEKCKIAWKPWRCCKQYLGHLVEIWNTGFAREMWSVEADLIHEVSEGNKD